MEKFEIISVSSEIKFIFSNQVKNKFTFEITGNKLNAQTEVYSFTDEFGLAELFKSANESGKPWKDAKIWESLEGEFKIELKCNSKGRINIKVELVKWAGNEENWSLTSHLITELGQLPRIEVNACEFFGV